MFALIIFLVFFGLMAFFFVRLFAAMRRVAAEAPSVTIVVAETSAKPEARIVEPHD